MSSAPPHPRTPCDTSAGGAALGDRGGRVVVWRIWTQAYGCDRRRAADCREPGPDCHGLTGAVGGAGLETVGVGRPNVLTPESVGDHQAPSE
jgi:hypothetical protein